MYMPNSPVPHHPGDIRDHIQIPRAFATPTRTTAVSPQFDFDEFDLDEFDLDEFDLDEFDQVSPTIASPLDVVLSPRRDTSQEDSLSEYIRDMEEYIRDMDAPPQMPTVRSPLLHSPVPIVDEERLNREDEATMIDCRRRVRDKRQQIDDMQRQIEALERSISEDESLEEETASRYVLRQNVQQADVFRQANRDDFLEVVSAYRRRRTMPRTYTDHHRYTRNI
ncbi:unnamed protein product [Absidia cylindrospora]